ncbi:helix-turn-helix domain-containing protein [Methylobacterium sp. NPDC080182]|uniref:helix-turn-helix domain-containing protein n=1 Tax=Methylobacterium sp. NPDC080182 TaxID=3390590 RepID=UPI003D04A06B
MQVEDEPITFEVSSGNVFADLDVPEAADEAIKARLVMRLRAEMDRRGLSQTEFAKVLGVKQPDVSNLLRGRVLGFSLERMFEFTRELGDDVEITLRPSKAERRGRMSLKVA